MCGKCKLMNINNNDNRITHSKWWFKYWFLSHHPSACTIMVTRRFWGAQGGWFQCCEKWHLINTESATTVVSTSKFNYNSVSISNQTRLHDRNSEFSLFSLPRHSRPTCPYLAFKHCVIDNFSRIGFEVSSFLRHSSIIVSSLPRRRLTNFFFFARTRFAQNSDNTAIWPIARHCLQCLSNKFDIRSMPRLERVWVGGFESQCNGFSIKRIGKFAKFIQLFRCT